MERFEGLANGDPGQPAGRELELAGLLRFIKAMADFMDYWVPILKKC